MCYELGMDKVFISESNEIFIALLNRHEHYPFGIIEDIFEQ